MGFVRTFEDFAPPPRVDGVPFNRVEIREAAAQAGLFTLIDTINLSPLDADPQHPQARSFTTSAAALDVPAWYRLSWRDAASGTFTGEPLLYLGVTADGYPSLSSLLAESTNAALAALDTAEQLDLRASAISAIERWTGQTFTQEGNTLAPVQKLVDATGGNTIWLPKRLVELTDFAVTNSWMTLSDVVLDEEHKRIYIAPVETPGGSTWATRAIAEMTLGVGPRRFPQGPGLVAVTGVWGWLASDWDAGPLDAVARAIRFDMEDRIEDGSGASNDLADTVRAARAVGVKSIAQGGVSLTLGGGEPTLSPRVRRELAGYLWEGRIGAAI